MADIESLLTGDISRTAWDVRCNYARLDQFYLQEYIIPSLNRLDETEGVSEEFVAAFLLHSAGPEYMKSAVSAFSERLAEDQPDEVLQVVEYCEQIAAFHDAIRQGSLSQQDYMLQLFYIAYHSAYFNEKLEEGIGRDNECLSALRQAARMLDTMDRDVFNTSLYHETMKTMLEISEILKQYYDFDESSATLKDDFQNFKNHKRSKDGFRF